MTADGHRGNDISMAGFFFRGNYAYKGKYIFNGSIRYDGHSALSKDNRWAPFAAAGLGWTISEENFMKNITWLSTLKLRGSYGTTGNTNMSSDMLIMTWSILNDRHWAGSTITSSQNWGPSGSSDLKWETTSSYDFGFDFGLFKDRINGSFAVYEQDIKDLIMKCQVPPSMGYHNAYNWKNVGDLTNKGIEFNVSSVNINTQSGFRWTSDFNISTNKNKIKRLNDQEKGKGAVQDNIYIRKEGESLNTYYLPKYSHLNTENGLYMQEELDKTKWDNEYVTVSTGKQIPMIGTNPGNNKFIQSGKTPQPKWYGGFSNNFSYKGFDLNIQLNFAGGNWIMDDVMNSSAKSIGAISMIILIIAGGGAFSQVLKDSHVIEYIRSISDSIQMNPLLMAFLIASIFRLAVGSATVATLTTAPIMLPIAQQTGTSAELMVLATGAGSVMWSHFNDSGFWMFKEYFGLNIKQTFQTWTLMESTIGVVGIVTVMIISAFI